MASLPPLPDIKPEVPTSFLTQGSNVGGFFGDLIGAAREGLTTYMEWDLIRNPPYENVVDTPIAQPQGSYVPSFDRVAASLNNSYLLYGGAAIIGAVVLARLVK